MKQKYQTTKKECQKQIGDSVCSRCGRPCVPLKTVNNSDEPTYWSGCMHGVKEKGAWGHFDNGVSKEVHKLAYKLVLEDSSPFRIHIEKGDNFDYKFMESVGDNCRTILSLDYTKKNKPRFTKKELRKQYGWSNK